MFKSYRWGYSHGHPKIVVTKAIQALISLYKHRAATKCNFYCFQKKALQALKAPRPEPERTPTPKRPMEAQNAKEVAKKLLKSGAITAIPRIPKRPEQAGFKRPRGLERKLSGTDRTVSGYQPFSATQLDDQETESLRPRVNVSLGISM